MTVRYRLIGRFFSFFGGFLGCLFCTTFRLHDYYLGVLLNGSYASRYGAVGSAAQGLFCVVLYGSSCDGGQGVGFDASFLRRAIFCFPYIYFYSYLGRHSGPRVVYPILFNWWDLLCYPYESTCSFVFSRLHSCVGDFRVALPGVRSVHVGFLHGLRVVVGCR